MRCLSRPMIKIRNKQTGDITEVTRNIAFDLIDRGIAELVRETREVNQSFGYQNRQMHSSREGRGSFRTK